MNKALIAARKKREAMKAAGIKAERLDPIEKSRRNPKSLRLAINASCWDCIGCGCDPNPRKAIADCQIQQCSLYNVRPYQHMALNNKQE